MRVQPVIVISPLAWFIITFWKPIAVACVVLAVLLSLTFPIVRNIAMDAAARYDAAAPTAYIPAVWRAALTEAALTPTATPWPTP